MSGKATMALSLSLSGAGMRRPIKSDALRADAAQERFRALYRAYVGTLHAYALRRTTADSAEDVVAETFLVAWRRLSDVPEDEGALPWLLGVARRVLANAARSGQRHSALVSRLQSEPPGVQQETHGDGLDPVLLGALARLPADDRELLCLLAWEKLDRRAAADVLGCSQAALRLRLHRARRRLLAELSDNNTATDVKETP